MIVMIIRGYSQDDMPDLIQIWNEVVEEGIAFPQEEYLTMETGTIFFASQSYTGVAVEDGIILGLYILHPNNVGRCGHICNASYAVASGARGRHIGEKLVLDCLQKGRELNFRVLQFKRPSQILCKPPKQCRIDILQWRFYNGTEERQKPGRTSATREDPRAAAAGERGQHG
jgi:L-amino acid N-acyltransferase YncA